MPTIARPGYGSSAPNGARGSAPINKNPWRGSALVKDDAPGVISIGSQSHPTKNPWQGRTKLKTTAPNVTPTQKQI